MYNDEEIRSLLEDVRDVLYGLEEKVDRIEHKLESVDMVKVNKLLDFIDECEMLENDECCGKGCGSH